RVEHVKLFAFTVSAVMAGLAGALYVPQVGIINPGEFSPANSIEVVIWTAVGGRGTLVGPIIGAVLVNMGKSYFTGAFPDLWLFVLGGLFVFVTLVMPKGIAGVFTALWTRLRRRSETGHHEPDDDEPAVPAPGAQARASAAAESGIEAGDVRPSPAE